LKRAAILTTLLGALLGCRQLGSPPDSAAEAAQASQPNAGSSMSHPELEFFNSLSGKLEIELTVPPEKIGNLDNVRATPEAKIKALKFAAELFNRESGTARELTPEELKSVAFRGSQITLRGEGGGAVTHQAPNGKFFTIQDMLNAVAETERQTRDKSEWFDGVDVHHVFFEGIHPGEDGVWEIYWGS
jgi:hypothetical protein